VLSTIALGAIFIVFDVEVVDVGDELGVAAAADGLVETGGQVVTIEIDIMPKEAIDFAVLVAELRMVVFQEADAAIHLEAIGLTCVFEAIALDPAELAVVPLRLSGSGGAGSQQAGGAQYCNSNPFHCVSP
jgi:hypothetical protein